MSWAVMVVGSSGKKRKRGLKGPVAMKVVSA
jgi:hypothetical protein